MNATNVALPKTYHHFESSGAICFIGESRTLTPRRSSSQFQIVLNNLMTAWWKAEGSPGSFALLQLLSAPRSGIAEAAADRRVDCRDCNKHRRDTATWRD